MRKIILSKIAFVFSLIITFLPNITLASTSELNLQNLENATITHLKTIGAYQEILSQYFFIIMSLIFIIIILLFIISYQHTQNLNPKKQNNK